MTRVIALLCGIAAWIAVAAIAVLVVNASGTDDQVLAFWPIAAAVVGAWFIGELVTDRVFAPVEREEGGHGHR